MNLFARSSGKSGVPVSLRSASSSGWWIRGIAFCLLLLGAAATQAQVSATLSWNQSAAIVAGYRVYQGTPRRAYTSSADAGKNLQLQINGLTPGVTYFFAVCSYGSSGVSSDFSPEIAYTATSPALPPPVVNVT